ncbi:hypothetical protein GWI33_019041 [Rhynchophorus ferrugineus]|uniref:Uncharacterized protein n=1 Tax=Rhynchophorus ferrugineus TaxID=354439 RepID=A0A834HUM3_RHYFE|nr:hypothetical protein GWI33_019041 [Rhynchophorus ferrugineus]
MILSCVRISFEPHSRTFDLMVGFLGGCRALLHTSPKRIKRQNKKSGVHPSEDIETEHLRQWPPPVNSYVNCYGEHDCRAQELIIPAGISEFLRRTDPATSSAVPLMVMRAKGKFSDKCRPEWDLVEIRLF